MTGTVETGTVAPFGAAATEKSEAAALFFAEMGIEMKAKA